MKQKTILAVLAASSLAAATASAQSPLLTTDIVDKGQIEAEADFNYFHTNRHIYDENGRSRVSSTTYDSSYFLGLGLGGNIEISAAIPFVFYDREKTVPDGGSATYGPKISGEGDVELGIQYRPVGGGQNDPLKVVVGFSAKLDSAGKNDAGTGTIDYKPYIATTWNATEHVHPFFIYEATIRKHGQGNAHKVTLATGIEVSPQFVLDMGVTGVFHDYVAGSTEHYQNVGFDLFGYWKVTKNFYIIPNAGIEWESRRNVAVALPEDPSTRVLQNWGPQIGYGAGLGLYFYY